MARKPGKKYKEIQWDVPGKVGRVKWNVEEKGQLELPNINSWLNSWEEKEWKLGMRCDELLSPFTSRGERVEWKGEKKREVIILTNVGINATET